MLRNEKRVCNNMYVCAFCYSQKCAQVVFLCSVNTRPTVAIVVMINYCASAGLARLCIQYTISLPIMWQANVTNIILFIINLK